MQIVAILVFCFLSFVFYTYSVMFLHNKYIAEILNFDNITFFQTYIIYSFIPSLITLWNYYDYYKASEKSKTYSLDESLNAAGCKFVASIIMGIITMLIYYFG